MHSSTFEMIISEIVLVYVGPQGDSLPSLFTPQLLFLVSVLLGRRGGDISFVSQEEHKLSLD